MTKNVSLKSRFEACFLYTAYHLIITNDFSLHSDFKKIWVFHVEHESKKELNDQVKQNTKFLWLYTAILFSFALVLIFIAGLTQNNYKKELAVHENASKGMQESVSQLTNHNQQLSDQLKTANANIAQLQTELDTLKNEQAESLHAAEANDQALLEALQLYEAGRRRDARERLGEMDRVALSPTQAYLYDQITH